METLRVIQWNTGKVGRLALRAILDRPDLDLVGVYAHGADKVGRDAGELCGRPDTGIKATNALDTLLATRADVAIYTPFTGNVDDVVRLLEGGVNVLSTNLFFHVGGVKGDVKDRLEAACQRGSSSLYITGINPGWINSVSVALTGVCGRVDSVSIYESADCSSYQSVETWNYFRMGQRGVTPEVIQGAKTWLGVFRDAAERVGEALGVQLDNVEFYCEYATAAERVDLGWFLMEKGTNAAVRAGWTGKVKGRTAVRAQITWYLTKKLAEAWDIDSDEYHVVVDGAPSIDMRMRFAPPTNWDEEWSATSTTAFAAVNAIPQIKAAPPGVLNLHDIGLPSSRGAVKTEAEQRT